MNEQDLYELIEIMFPKEVEQLSTTLGDLEESDLENILYDNWDIDFDQFYLLIERLLPLCNIAQSELTGKWYRGFGKDGFWAIKQEIND